MLYRILCVGKIKDSFYRKEIERFCDQIRRRRNAIEIIELPDVKIPDHMKENNKEVFLEKECSRMQDKISNQDYVIALCIEGKEITTKKHRDLVEKAKEDGYRSITYVIGGSLGLPEWVKKRANVRLSFSKMTFPHQLMRMVLCEEITHVLSV